VTGKKYELRPGNQDGCSSWPRIQLFVQTRSVP